MLPLENCSFGVVVLLFSFLAQTPSLNYISQDTPQSLLLLSFMMHGKKYRLGREHVIVHREECS